MRKSIALRVKTVRKSSFLIGNLGILGMKSRVFRNRTYCPTVVIGFVLKVSKVRVTKAWTISIFGVWSNNAVFVLIQSKCCVVLFLWLKKTSGSFLAALSGQNILSFVAKCWGSSGAPVSLVANSFHPRVLSQLAQRRLNEFCKLPRGWRHQSQVWSKPSLAHGSNESQAEGDASFPQNWDLLPGTCWKDFWLLLFCSLWSSGCAKAFWERRLRLLGLACGVFHEKRMFNGEMEFEVCGAILQKEPSSHFHGDWMTLLWSFLYSCF